MEKVKSHESEISVEERLRALYSLQLVDSEIDKIKTLRGELPLEVQDLEDDVAGLETRIGNLKEELDKLEK
jgi:predicted  nucleic acid-binding Zn-ribbon protein